MPIAPAHRFVDLDRAEGGRGSGARVGVAARDDAGDQAAGSGPEGGGNSPLLSITNLAAASGPETASRLEKWELQSYARLLLPKERIRFCCLSRIPGRKGVDVYHSPAHSSAHFGGLITCGSVWQCPVCSARISERRRELLSQAVASCRAMGGQVLLAGYTFSHGRSDRLSVSLSALLAAQRSMTGNRPYKRLTERFGIVGTVTAREVTWGVVNGWHPHAHALLFAPSEIDVPTLEDELWRAWAMAAHREGLTMTRRHGLHLTGTTDAVGEYVAKWGSRPTRRLWEAPDELAKSHSKRAHRADGSTPGYSPFDLLRWLADTGESQPAALFRDYAATFKGRYQLTWSRGLAELLGVGDDAAKSDEEIAGEVREDAVLLATLTPFEWRAVRLTGQRGQLLEVARTGDVAALWAFVRQLVAEVAVAGRTAGDQAAGGVA